MFELELGLGATDHPRASGSVFAQANTSSSILHRAAVVATFVAVITAIALPVSAAPLSESDVVARVRDHNAQILAAREGISAAEADLVSTELYPNPELAWEREHFAISPQEAEDSFSITVPIDPFGGRASRSAMAASEIASVTAEVLRTQSRVTHRALRLFYSIVSALRRAEIDENAVAALGEVRGILAKRYGEGTASGYDVARVEIETELAASRLRQARNGVDRVRIELTALLALPPDTEFSGALILDAPAREPRAPGERVSILRMQDAERHARDASAASGTAWLPALSLTAGLKVGTTSQMQFGYVAGVSVPLPFFSRGQDVVAAAQARSRVAKAQTLVAQQAFAMETRVAEAGLRAASEELKRFEDATASGVVKLERAARSAYQEGRLSIVELLDAQRARMAVEGRQLELALAAKISEVALRAARGEFE